MPSMVTLDVTRNTCGLCHPLLGQELLRDSKSIKTESTSRESDEHLQFREVAILRRKNKRLQTPG